MFASRNHSLSDSVSALSTGNVVKKPRPFDGIAGRVFNVASKVQCQAVRERGVCLRMAVMNVPVADSSVAMLVFGPWMSPRRHVMKRIFADPFVVGMRACPGGRRSGSVNVQ